jgi:DNA repair protein RecO (recombination protein O)
MRRACPRPPKEASAGVSGVAGMPSYQGPAFVLRKWDLGESDQLVSFLSASRGKMRGIAKGAKRSKKRFGGLLSPFLLVHLECFESPNRDLVRIEGCALIHYYASVYANLEKLLVGCCALELIERVLPERGMQEDWFLLLRAFLDCLDREEGPGPLLSVFFVKGLQLLGLQPQFGKCIHCRRPLVRSGVFGFSVPQGGVVCGGCVGRGTATHRAAAETLLLMDRWLVLPMKEAVSTAGAADRRAREAARLLEAFLTYHAGRELRSLRVMREVLSKRQQAG